MSTTTRYCPPLCLPPSPRYTPSVLLFDVLPLPVFLALALAGVLVGYGLRLLLHAWQQRGEPTETRAERFTLLVGRLTQSAAIGLALTLVADLLLVSRINDARLLAVVTLLLAALTSFAAAFLRELIRRLFYQDL
jgi:peptidoglycan biosynthesis protein MviN/MurJ (putative lipid II flippase)